MQSASPSHPPRPAVAYVKELTALEAPLQRAILREWLARSETTTPSSLADDYDEFVITTVRDRPKATPSRWSLRAAATRKLPTWTLAVGALPVIIAFVLVLVDVGRSALPSPRPALPISTIQTAAVVETAPVLETPPSEAREMATAPMPTVAPARKSPEAHAAVAKPAQPVTTAAIASPPATPEVDKELIANSDFGDRK